LRIIENTSTFRYGASSASMPPSFLHVLGRFLFGDVEDVVDGDDPQHVTVGIRHGQKRAGRIARTPSSASSRSSVAKQRDHRRVFDFEDPSVRVGKNERRQADVFDQLPRSSTMYTTLIVSIPRPLFRMCSSASPARILGSIVTTSASCSGRPSHPGIRGASACF